MAAKESLPSLPPGDGTAPPRKRSRIKLFVILGSILLVFGTAAGATYWLFFKEVKFSDIIGMVMSSSSEDGTSGSASGGGSTSGSAEGQNAGTSGNPNTGGGNEKVKDAPPPVPGSKGVPRPVPLPELTVNLADPSGTRYLKIGMEVELTSPEVAQELQAQNARVRDAIILLLSSKTVAQLATPEGKVLLKNEVAARLNQILGAPRIVRIFFTNFVFQ